MSATPQRGPAPIPMTDDHRADLGNRSPVLALKAIRLHQWLQAQITKDVEAGEVDDDLIPVRKDDQHDSLLDRVDSM